MPCLAVDVGDRAAARRGVREGRVVGHQAEVVLVDLDLAEVHRPDGPVGDRDLVGLAGAVVRDREGVLGGGYATAVLPLRLLVGHRASPRARPFLLSSPDCCGRGLPSAVELARGPPTRRRAVRLHVPGAALPPPVAVGLVLPRDRLARASTPSARARSCARCCAPGAPTGFVPAHGVLGWPRGLAARAVLRDRHACAARPRPRRSGRRCSPSPGSSSPTATPSSSPRASGRCARTSTGSTTSATSTATACSRSSYPDESGLDDSPKYDPVFGWMAHHRPGLLPARAPLPAAALRRAADRRALRRARRGRAGQRRLRAVAARLRADVGRRVVRRARRAHRGARCSSAAWTRDAACSSTSPAADEEPVRGGDLERAGPARAADAARGRAPPPRRGAPARRRGASPRRSASRASSRAEPSLQPALRPLPHVARPSWVNTAWLLVPALRELGYEEPAERIVASLAAAVERDGFREYYDPLTGRGPRRARVRLVDAAGGAVKVGDSSYEVEVLGDGPPLLLLTASPRLATAGAWSPRRLPSGAPRSSATSRATARADPSPAGPRRGLFQPRQGRRARRAHGAARLRALRGRRPRPRRPGRLPDGARPPGGGRAAVRAQHRPDGRAVRAAGPRDRTRLLALFLMAQPAPFPERLVGASAEFFLRHTLDAFAGAPAPSRRARPSATCARSRPEAIAGDLLRLQGRASTSTGRWTQPTARPGGGSPARCWCTGARRRARCPTTAGGLAALGGRVEGRPMPGGHFLPEEAPEQLTASLRDFL